MKLIVSFLGGIIFALVVLAGVGYFVVKTGIIPANADSKPAAVESWVANTALDATLERETKALKNPIQPSDENLITGLHLYAENLRDMPWRIGCQALEPRQRLLYRGTAAGQRWSRRGSRDHVVLEGQAWHPLHGDAELYHHAAGRRDLEIAMFLKQMDKLPPTVDAEWKKVPSVAVTPAGTSE